MDMVKTILTLTLGIIVAPFFLAVYVSQVILGIDDKIQKPNE